MRTKIIAECSTNHCGDMEIAKEMIKTAASCGADFVKFQSFKADHLVGDGWDIHWYKKTELSENDHIDLIECCKENNVEFLTTCFDRRLIPFLSTLGMEYIKVASTDNESYGMLEELSENFEHIIVSTGMMDSEDIVNLLNNLEDFDVKHTIMHCISEYPTKPKNSNLFMIDNMNFEQGLWNHEIGFSDHSLGIEVAKVALCKNISMIEKHFILDKTMTTPDVKVSIDPMELRELCEYRDFVEVVNGTGTRVVSEEELKVKKKYVGRWGDNRFRI